MKEDEVIVLDYLHKGYTGMKKIEPILQTIGTSYFTLLELVPEKEAELGEIIKLSDTSRVKYIRRKLKESDLTNFARNNLEPSTKKIVKLKESYFVDFFNKATKISIRMHKLELIPNIGKKHVQIILGERKKKPFESFDDLKKRAGITVEIEGLIAKRIIEELKGNEKYSLFVNHFPTPAN